VRVAAALRLGHLDGEVAPAAQLLDGGLGVLQRLAVGPVDVLHRVDALALDGTGHDGGRPAAGGDRLLVGLLDGGDVVAVDLDGVPAEGAQPLGVGAGVPAVAGLLGLAQAVHVEDGGEVVEVGEGRLLERLPHRPLGQLAVAGQHPHPVRQPVQVLSGQRQADADRQPLAE
jgi:hypothetical protein